MSRNEKKELNLIKKIITGKIWLSGKELYIVFFSKFIKEDEHPDFEEDSVVIFKLDISKKFYGFIKLGNIDECVYDMGYSGDVTKTTDGGFLYLDSVDEDPTISFRTKTDGEFVKCDWKKFMEIFREFSDRKFSWYSGNSYVNSSYVGCYQLFI